jgi:hypothetical protein
MAKKRPGTVATKRSRTAAGKRPGKITKGRRATMAPAVVGVIVGQITLPNGESEWTILPEDDDANRTRFTPFLSEIQARWVTRNPKGPTPGTDHRPIIFNEGDTLQLFNPTDYPIGIGLYKNPLVDGFPGAPDDPLVGCPGVQSIGPGQRLNVNVMAGGATPGPKDQGFYKFHGWVKVGGTFISLDPDGYCGG